LVTYTAKRDGFLDPIRPLLLPEIADDRNWVGGVDGLFGDRERKFVPTYTMTIDRTTMANYEIIKEEELKSSSQLLDPKFKGRIVIQTPTAGGSFSSLCNLSIMYGENFVRELLLKQNMIVTNDARQQAEWVVRGKYPIGIGLNETQLIPYVKQGLGKNINDLEDKIIPVGTSFGGLFLFKNAPHPNVARVYINWLLSRSTQVKLSRNVLLNSKRTDVPPAIKELVVDAAHLSNYYLYTTEEAVENSNRLLTMFKDVLKL